MKKKLSIETYFLWCYCYNSNVWQKLELEPEPKLWTKVEPELEPKINNFGSATLE